MTQGVYSGVSAMASAQKRLDGLADNLANLSTTGYKRRSSFVHALADARGGGGEELRVGARIDFSQGQIQRTGNALHLALEGRGFLAAEGAQGEVYTRNGAMVVGRDGVLQTPDGLPFAWDELTGAIDPAGEALEIDAAGNVSQGGRDVGRLRIAAFADEQRLTQDSAGYFHAPPELREVAHEATVHQGALEGSNVSAIEEMVEMISVQRAFGGASNVLGMISETYQRLSRLQ